MFHKIPKPIRDRMAYLEAIDTRDRVDGTQELQRLRQIPPVTGRLLALLAAAAPPGRFLEIGASAGYSALWISLALQERDDRLVTFELLADKVRYAQETFQAAGTETLVQIIPGDVRTQLSPFCENVAFCFLDTEKDLYSFCYEQVVPGLVPGGFLVVDNVISHAEVLADFLKRAGSDSRVDTLTLPVGQGVLLCRKAKEALVESENLR